MRFVALLRGVNVSGKNGLKMADLRDAMVELGLKGVETYIQSGNIVFESSGSQVQLPQKIRTKLKKDFSVDTPVIVRSAKEWAALIKRNTLVKKGRELNRLHVTLLGARTQSKDLENKLERFRTNGELFLTTPLEIYLHTPLGYGVSKLNNNVIERITKVEATTRNWNTVLALQAMLNK